MPCLSSPSFFVLVCRLSAPPERPVSNMTLIPMGLVAVGDIAIGSARRRRYLQDCQDFFKAEANLRKALGRWYMGNIVSFVHAETVALFGLALKFLGASWLIAGPFFTVGLAVMLVWTPRTPDWAAGVPHPPIQQEG